MLSIKPKEYLIMMEAKRKRVEAEINRIGLRVAYAIFVVLNFAVVLTYGSEPIVDWALIVGIQLAIFGYLLNIKERLAKVEQKVDDLTSYFIDRFDKYGRKH